MKVKSSCVVNTAKVTEQSKMLPFFNLVMYAENGHDYPTGLLPNSLNSIIAQILPEKSSVNAERYFMLPLENAPASIYKLLLL